MSSSNRVQISVIPETEYGVTPVEGNFQAVRFTDESLSGTPETTTSVSIRADRQNSGQFVTGLTVTGDINTEMCIAHEQDLLLSSAMMNDWVTNPAVTVDLTINNEAKTITRVDGDFNDNIHVADMIVLKGFTNPANNTMIQITEVQPTSLTYVGNLQDEVGTATSFRVADYLDVGLKKKSFSIEKAYQDLTTKAVNYKGMLVDELDLDASWGSAMKAKYTFQGNHYEAVNEADKFLTHNRMIDEPASNNILNGSIDIPFVSSSMVQNAFTKVPFCLSSVQVSLKNNLTAKNCIGSIAPKGHSEGTASVEVNFSTYLSDSNYELMFKKLTQEEFKLGFIVQNLDGAYGFYMPAVQVSFDDPASAGQNQEVMIEAKGVAKVGANGESELRIYRMHQEA